MYPYDFIYTPPEIIAQEVKKEFDRPASGYGTPSSKKERIKAGFVLLAVLTSPIWGGMALMLLCKTWFGF